MNTKNYGLIPEPLNEIDFKFGATKKGMEVRVPEGDWEKYLPGFEKQRRQDEDKMWCVSASAENTIETEFIYQIKNRLISVEDMEWLDKKGYLDENGLPDFSDRFTAILSKTTANGNSPKRVAHAIHEYGLIPEKMLPYRKSMSWRECYGYGKWETPNTRLITKEMKALGQEFLKRFPINYEFPRINEFDEALKRNPIQVFVHAWNGVSNGVYVRTTAGINHAVEKIKKMPNQKIFDTYEPRVKSLADNFILMSYGTRFILSFKKQLTKETTMTKLLREIGKEKVYGIRGGKKYWCVSWDSLLDWTDYKTKEEAEDAILGVTKIHLDTYRDGGVVGNPTILDLIFGGVTK